jgi:hypothetical protein
LDIDSPDRFALGRGLGVALNSDLSSSSPSGEGVVSRSTMPIACDLSRCATIAPGAIEHPGRSPEPLKLQ